MSLLAIAVAAAAASAATPAIPAHSVQLDHRGATYRIDYRPQVIMSTRTIGIAPPTRMSSQRCVLTATVSVERVVNEGPHELRATLPGGQTYQRQLAGDCRGRDGQLATLVAQKSPAIARHVASVASADRHEALAAIEAAHHFAAN